MFPRTSGVAPTELHSPRKAQDNMKSKDYVYLALASSQRNCIENTPDIFGCNLHGLDCTDTNTNVEQNDRRSKLRLKWKILIISGIINVCLFVLSVALTTSYLQLYTSDTRNTQRDTFYVQSVNKTLTNGTCMVRQLCTDVLWDQYQDHFYWFSWQHVTWAKARQQCHQLGSDLVSIESRRENDFLTRKMLSKFKPGSRPNGFYFWIGLMRDITASELVFQWVDGSMVTFEEWSVGQPDNEGGIEHCGQSSLSPGNRGGWADRRCWTEQPFVCKRHAGRL